MESSAENDDPDVVSEEIDSYIDSYNDSINESDIDYDNPVKIGEGTKIFLDMRAKKLDVE